MNRTLATSGDGGTAALIERRGPAGLGSSLAPHQPDVMAKSPTEMSLSVRE